MGGKKKLACDILSSLLLGEFYVPPPRDTVLRYAQRERCYDVREFEGQVARNTAVSEFVGFDRE